MPNPTGKNNLTPQPAYGDVQKQQQLTREAPMSGAPTAPLNAPRRAQRAAARGRRAAPPKPTVLQGSEAPGEPPPIPPEPAEPSTPSSMAFWTDAAALPGASDLIHFYAQRAQQEG